MEQLTPVVSPVRRVAGDQQVNVPAIRRSTPVRSHAVDLQLLINLFACAVKRQRSAPGRSIWGDSPTSTAAGASAASVSSRKLYCREQLTVLVELFHLEARDPHLEIIEVLEPEQLGRSESPALGLFPEIIQASDPGLEVLLGELLPNPVDPAQRGDRALTSRGLRHLSVRPRPDDFDDLVGDAFADTVNLFAKCSAL